MTSPCTDPPNPPAVFQVSRDLPPLRYSLLEVFQGLERVPAFEKYPGSPGTRRSLARDTTVEIARRRGEWMYVAPHELPPNADRTAGDRLPPPRIAWW